MLIGISGAAGSGKTTLADALAKEFSIRQRGLADPIKRGIEAMFGLHPAMWDDRITKELEIDWLGRSPRYLAQTLGTEWGRELVNPRVWLLIAEQYHKAYKSLIIPDIRFENEALWIRENGGALIHIERSNLKLITESNHSSEGGYDPEHRTSTIINDGTPDDLAVKGKEALKCGFGF